MARRRRLKPWINPLAPPRPLLTDEDFRRLHVRGKAELSAHELATVLRTLEARLAQSRLAWVDPGDEED